MTVREGGPPGGLLRWLLFDDINHPRYAKFIGDFAKAMRPESFLPGHFDFSVSGKIVKPAFSFFDLLRIEHQRKAGVMMSLPAMRTLAWAMAVSGNCIPEGQFSALSCADFGISPKLIL